MDSPRGRIYLMKAGVEGRAELTPSLRAAHRQLPGLPGLRDGVSVGRAVRAADRAARARRSSSATRGRPATGCSAALLMALVPVSRAHAAGRWRRWRWPAGWSAAGAAGCRRAADGLWRRLVAMVELAPPVTFGGAVRQHAGGDDAGGGAERLTGGAAHRLRAAAVVRARQPGHRARAGRGRVPRGGARARRAAAARCRCTPATSSRRAQLARHNIEVFERLGVDRIVVNAAGCGSAMKEYGELFERRPGLGRRARARSAPRCGTSRRCWPNSGQPRAPRQPDRAPASSTTTPVTSRTARACAPSRARCCRPFPGIELVTPAEAEICCGSAGIYNLVQPGPAAELGAAQGAQPRRRVSGYDCHRQSGLHAANRGRGAACRA